MVKAKDIGLISGLKAGHIGEVVTHIQFVDDTILFCSRISEEVVVRNHIPIQNLKGPLNPLLR